MSLPYILLFTFIALLTVIPVMLYLGIGIGSALWRVPARQALYTPAPPGTIPAKTVTDEHHESSHTETRDTQHSSVGETTIVSHAWMNAIVSWLPWIVGAVLLIGLLWFLSTIIWEPLTPGDTGINAKRGLEWFKSHAGEFLLVATLLFILYLAAAYFGLSAFLGTLLLTGILWYFATHLWPVTSTAVPTITIPSIPVPSIPDALNVFGIDLAKTWEWLKANTWEAVLILVFLYIIYLLIMSLGFLRGLLTAFVLYAIASLLFTDVNTVTRYMKSFWPTGVSSSDVSWSDIPKGMKPTRIVHFSESKWTADLNIPAYHCYLLYPGYDTIKRVNRYTKSSGHHLLVTPIEKVPLTLKFYTFPWPEGRQSLCPA